MVLGAVEGTNMQGMDPFEKQEYLRPNLAWAQRTEKLQLTSNCQSGANFLELSEGLEVTASVSVIISACLELCTAPASETPDKGTRRQHTRCFPALTSANS